MIASYGRFNYISYIMIYLASLVYYDAHRETNLVSSPQHRHTFYFAICKKMQTRQVNEETNGGVPRIINFSFTSAKSEHGV